MKKINSTTRKNGCYCLVLNHYYCCYYGNCCCCCFCYCCYMFYVVNAFCSTFVLFHSFMKFLFNLHINYFSLFHTIFLSKVQLPASLFFNVLFLFFVFFCFEQYARSNTVGGVIVAAKRSKLISTVHLHILIPINP